MTLVYHKQVARYALGGNFNPLNWATPLVEVMKHVGQVDIACLFVCRLNILAMEGEQLPIPFANASLQAPLDVETESTLQPVLSDHIAKLQGPAASYLQISQGNPARVDVFFSVNSFVYLQN